MGLDLILGAVVLAAALRGWFRGFFAQAIRIGGLVGGIALAGPLRDLARPIAAERLTSMAPELLDRLLWWVAAVVAFVLLSGVAGGVLSAARRRMERERLASGVAGPSHRGDQSAGALLGAAKGAILVAFLLAGLQRYVPEYARAGGWIGEQVESSHVLAWSTRYEPARRIWESEPVRALVAHVRAQGFGISEPGDGAAESDDPGRALAAGSGADDSQARAPGRRPGPLAVEPGGSRAGAGPAPRRPDGKIDLQAALDEVRRDLERLDALRQLAPR